MCQCLASKLNVHIIGSGPYPGHRPIPAGHYGAEDDEFQATFFANATAIYTGTFYGVNVPRTPDYLHGEKLHHPLELVVTLLDAKWPEDIGTNPQKKQMLLDSVRSEALAVYETDPVLIIRSHSPTSPLSIRHI